MSRNGSGIYTLPSGINPVVPGTTITTTWANPTLDDVAQALTGSLPRDGQAPMTGVLKIVDGSSTTPGISFNSEPSTGIFTSGTGVMAFATSASEKMRLQGANLLIGTTVDNGEKLNVNGTTRLQGALTVTTGGLTVTGNTSLTGTLSVSSTVTAASYNSTSTKRLKTKIRGLPKNYIARFSELKPKEFTWKKGDYRAGTIDFGFLAEDVQKLYPTAVGVDEKGQATGIDYGKLSTILAAKLLEVEARLAKLEK